MGACNAYNAWNVFDIYNGLPKTNYIISEVKYKL